MGNSRDKQFINFKLHALMSNVTTSYLVPLCPDLTRTWIIPLFIVSMLYMLLTHWSLRSHVGYQSTASMSQHLCVSNLYHT